MPGSHLCLVEREEIRVGVERGESFRQIARRLGRAASTIAREVARCGPRQSYRALGAHRVAAMQRQRQRATKLAMDGQLASQVRDRLESGWSPAPISHWLKTLGYCISPETIYRECYRPDSALGDDAWQLLVRSRPSRRRRRRTRSGIARQPLGDFRLITHRPPIEGPGHWEGDLLIGAQNRSGLVVLTERYSRFTLLGALKNQTADHVCQIVCDLLDNVPPSIRKTLTWDQGRELARWPNIEQHLNTTVFFCHPRSPWEKPLVENTCGLLRRWLARRSNLYRPQSDLDQIALLLNTMPRRSLNWNTAQTRYHQLRVATTS